MCPCADKPLQSHSLVFRSIYFVFVSFDCLFTIEKWFSRTISSHLQAESKCLLKKMIQRLLSSLWNSKSETNPNKKRSDEKIWNLVPNSRFSSFAHFAIIFDNAKKKSFEFQSAKYFFSPIKCQTHYSKFVFLWFILMHNRAIEILNWQKMRRRKSMLFALIIMPSHLGSFLIEQWSKIDNDNNTQIRWQWQQ